jgi:uncharacterized protein
MEEAPRTGDWFLSLGGHQLYPLDTRPGDIRIEEVAHALSHICRFGGHVRDFYSVAQHSVLVASALPEELKLVGLLHDATEAYCGDMIRPLKRSIPRYKEIEDRIWLAVAERFSLPVELPPSVKEADNRVLQVERRDLLAPHPWKWTIAQSETGNTPYDWRIEACWPPARACDEFLEEFHRLT